MDALASPLPTARTVGAGSAARPLIAVLQLPLFLILLAITLWTWRSTSDDATRSARERFDSKLNESQFAIQQRLSAYEQILRGGVGLFAAQRDVTRDQWRAYVRALDFEKRFPGIQGIGYAAAIPAPALPAHLRKLRAEGYTDYEIRPAGERSEYAAIAYMEPFDGRNLRSAGYDMLTEPALRDALLRARDSGLPAASGEVRLIKETGDGLQNGIVMCLAVYQPGLDATTPVQRRSALAGYVCAALRMRDLMKGIVGFDALSDIRLRIFDGSASTQRPMYDSLEDAGATQQAMFSGERAFEFGGHRWTLRFDSRPAFEASVDTQRPRLALISGLLVSALLSVVVGALLLNRRRARELAVVNAGLQAEIDDRMRLQAKLETLTGSTVGVASGAIDVPGEVDASADADRAALRQLQLHDAHRPLATAPATPSPAAPIGLPRILVADDSPVMLYYVSELLRDECDIVSAEDGEQAWELLQSVPVELIVSDVMMPRLDGFGLTARIKASARLSHLPVILLTARGGTDSAASGLESGADDYIAKPFSPQELKARVRAALRMGRAQAELRERSHQAGMAQIATNVLHNVGNVLNSVNVSADLIRSRLRASKLPGLGKAVDLMNEHAADLGPFLTDDDKGKQLPGYLRRLADALTAEQHDLIEEVSHLAKSIDHIKEIVSTQQTYAGAGSLTAAVNIRDLVDDALRMSSGSLTRHQVTVVKEVADVPLLRLDRHRLLLILVNLIGNAEQAMADVPEQARRITLAVDVTGERRLRIRVSDNGSGIAPENLTRIFAHGFTTRTQGHGFGLHSCAIAAVEMGGRLSANSDGPGKGATFALELPQDATAVAASP